VPAPPITPDLFAIDDNGALTLLGGRSASSGQAHFPLRPVCPFTGADDVEPVELPRSGRLLWWTTVQVAPPGYVGVVPYGLGVVALDVEPELRVVTRVLDPEARSTGETLLATAEEIETPDGPRTTWAFGPAEGGAA
jgi:uncharacterized OB-fold protein